jgi:hypothetical protein
MPVTTRSQAKRLKGLQCNHSSSSLKDLSIPSTFSTMSLSNNSTTASLTVPTCNSTTTTLSNIDNYNNVSSNHLEDSSLSLFRPSSMVSKFQNLEISNSVNFDLGICHPCHNSSISKSFIMEDDCEDSATMSSKKDDIQYMNQLFFMLSDQFAHHTNRIQDHFQDIVDQNDTFKQEVRSELDDL